MLTVDRRWELELATVRGRGLHSERPIVTPMLTTARDRSTPLTGVASPDLAGLNVAVIIEW